MRTRRYLNRVCFRSLLGATALLMLVAACGGKTPSNPNDSGQPKRGGTAIVEVLAEPATLDVAKNNSHATKNLADLVYSTLLDWTPDGDLVPHLATARPTITDNGKRYEIKLRGDVTWHDGKKFTADDVVFTIKKILIRENASDWRGSLSVINDVTAPDQSTVVLTLTHAYVPLEGMLAQFPIISSAYPYEPNKTWARTMMGTGPFKFVRWDTGSKIVLQRSDKYFLPNLPYLDGVEMRFVKSDAARIANIVNGDSTIMTHVPYSQITTLKNRGVPVVTTPRSAHMPTIWPSLKSGRPTADPRFRKAIAMAIDRGQLVDKVFYGNAVPASTILSSGFPYWDEQLGNTYGTSANVEGAKALLQQTGYDLNRELSIICRNDEETRQIATFIQSDLSKLGLKVTITPQDAAAYFPKLLSGDFDLMLLAIDGGLSIGLTNSLVYAVMKTGATTNYNGFSDAKMDELVTAAVANPADPKAAWRAVQERDLDLVPLIPVVTARYVEGFQPELAGYKPSSLVSIEDLRNAYFK